MEVAAVETRRQVASNATRTNADRLLVTEISSESTKSINETGLEIRPVCLQTFSNFNDVWL